VQTFIIIWALILVATIHGGRKRKIFFPDWLPSRNLWFMRGRVQKLRADSLFYERTGDLIEIFISAWRGGRRRLRWFLFIFIHIFIQRANASAEALICDSGVRTQTIYHNFEINKHHRNVCWVLESFAPCRWSCKRAHLAPVSSLCGPLLHIHVWIMSFATIPWVIHSFGIFKMI
jgi:hypothetical protein